LAIGALSNYVHCDGTRLGDGVLSNWKIQFVLGRFVVGGIGGGLALDRGPYSITASVAGALVVGWGRVLLMLRHSQMTKQ
jgi:hypothetical protein